jgi:tRNA(adenine34) deaminase
MTDQDYMRLAIREAEKAGAVGDVPVGAIIVGDDGQVIATGHNRREANTDPTAHAEIEALREAAKTLGSWHVEATIYVTQEPCPMCAGALVNARIKRLVFGCDNPKAGAVKTLFAIPTDPRLNHRIEVTANILAEECGQILKSFFARLRDR